MKTELINYDTASIKISEYEAVSLNELFGELDNFNNSRQDQILDRLMFMQEKALKNTSTNNAFIDPLLHATSRMVSLINVLAYNRSMIYDLWKATADLTKDDWPVSSEWGSKK